jgi:hypothetical protein
MQREKEKRIKSKEKRVESKGEDFYVKARKYHLGIF